MRLTLLQRGREEDQREMIGLSCKTALSRINKNFQSSMYLIQQLCRSYSLVYSHQFGALCAHISLHYHKKGQQGKGEEWSVANHLMNKYRLIFFQKKFIHEVEGHSLFEQFQDLVSYGMKCMAYPLDQEMVYHLNTNDKPKERLRNISVRLLKSLLLEYIPTDYSFALIKIYLQEKENTNKTELGSSRTEVMDVQNELYPYLNIFQLIQSLSKYLIDTKKPVHLDHYLQLMENPMMGVVEWPMVIGGRDAYQLPSVFS